MAGLNLNASGWKVPLPARKVGAILLALSSFGRRFLWTRRRRKRKSSIFLLVHEWGMKTKGALG